MPDFGDAFLFLFSMAFYFALVLITLLVNFFIVRWTQSTRRKIILRLARPVALFVVFFLFIQLETELNKPESFNTPCGDAHDIDECVETRFEYRNSSEAILLGGRYIFIIDVFITLILVLIYGLRHRNDLARRDPG